MQDSIYHMTLKSHLIYLKFVYLYQNNHIYKILPNPQNFVYELESLVLFIYLFKQLFCLFIQFCKYLTRYLWMIPCLAVSVNRLPNQRSCIETRRQISK